MTDAETTLVSRVRRARSSGLLIVTALSAAAAALARNADGRAMLSAWLELALQIPLMLVWMWSRGGWFVGRIRTAGVRPWGPDHPPELVPRRLEQSRDPSPTPGRGGAPDSFQAPSPTPGGGGAPRPAPHPEDRWLILLVVAGGIGIAAARGRPALFGTAVTFYICTSLLFDLLADIYNRLNSAIACSRATWRAFWPSWLGLILAATALLSSPLATQSAVPDYAHNFWNHVLNSAFAAASSACLVGTTIYSFGEDYTAFGQAVLVITGQLAGIGFCAIGLAIMGPFLNHRLRLGTVLRWAFGLQLLAVVVMAIGQVAPPAGGLAHGLWASLVLAGSALWNNGLILHPADLSSDLARGATFACMVTLSIVGSLGLPVLIDLIRRPPPEEPKGGCGMLPCRRLPHYEATGAMLLLLFGAIFLFYCETPRALPSGLVPQRPFDFGERQIPIRDHEGGGRRWTLAVLVSATARSAGLQCLPVSEGALSWPSYGLLLFLIFIGGSIAGTAGGVRLSSFLLPMIGLFSGDRGWKAALGGSAVRRLILFRVPLFVGLWMVLNALAVLALVAATDGDAYQWVFEGTAALNGVGLSTGLTPHLTVAGRFVMIFLFVGGRLIPAVFWLLLTHRISQCHGRDPIRDASGT